MQNRLSVASYYLLSSLVKQPLLSVECFKKKVLRKSIRPNLLTKENIELEIQEDEFLSALNFYADFIHFLQKTPNLLQDVKFWHAFYLGKFRKSTKFVKI